MKNGFYYFYPDDGYSECIGFKYEGFEVWFWSSFVGKFEDDYHWAAEKKRL